MFCYANLEEFLLMLALGVTIMVTTSGAFSLIWEQVIPLFNYAHTASASVFVSAYDILFLIC